MNKFYTKTKAALLASTLILPSQIAVAQDKDVGLEEIVVTAQKRTENLQDVPVSVQVLGNTQLENLNVNAFADYVKFLPTVSFTQSRPGIASIFMRGIVSSGASVHSGSMPSVGVYLDEQPITTINEILDLHMYDIARVETLSGPQGTLFGASSQAGTLRIITNKPEIGEFSAGYDVAVNTTKSGEMGYTLEGFVNVPISDKAAIRLVAWHETDGGYIDNVPGEITIQSTGEVINNAAFVEENFNDAKTTGARALLKVDLNENWTVTPSVTYQKQHSTGWFNHNPDDVGDLQVKRYVNEDFDEHWVQAGLTLEGKIGDLDVVYAGTYLDRQRDSQYDYTGFSEYYGAYYEHYYPGSGVCYAYTNAGDCANLLQFTTGDEKFKKQSHELRIQSSQENRVRWIAGVFYQKQEHNFDLRWLIPGAGSDYSVVPEDPNTVVWQTRQVREDRDKAVFGEIAFDITDNLTLTGGVRAFKYDNTLYGFNGYLAHCTYHPDPVTGRPDYSNPFNPDGSPAYPCFDTRILDGRSKGDGQTYKLNLTYKVDDDKMVYATYSEGYRPGGVNRARLPNIPGYDPDYVYNYELGWKTQWLDNRLRFNGALYHLNWDNIQFSFLDYAVSILTIIQNAGKSRTNGAEFDLDYAASENLTLSLSGSYNDAKLTTDYLRDVSDPDSLIAPKGTRMPFVPKVQLAASARYTHDMAGLPAFAQLSVAYTGGSYSDLDTNVYTQYYFENNVELTRETPGRSWQNEYAVVNLSAGIDGDNWSLGIFADNLFDNRAEIYRGDFVYTTFYSKTDTTNQTIRPRTIGIRFGQKF